MAADSKQEFLASTSQEASNRGREAAAEDILASGQDGLVTASKAAPVIENGVSEQSRVQRQGLGNAVPESGLRQHLIATAAMNGSSKGWSNQKGLSKDQQGLQDDNAAEESRQAENGEANEGKPNGKHALHSTSQPKGKLPIL